MWAGRPRVECDGRDVLRIHTMSSVQTRVRLLLRLAQTMPRVSGTAPLNCHRHDWPQCNLFRIQHGFKGSRPLSWGGGNATSAMWKLGHVLDCRGTAVRLPTAGTGTCLFRSFERATGAQPASDPVAARGSPLASDSQRMLEYEHHCRLFTLLIQPGDEC
jgi:hypothetical protein